MSKPPILISQQAKPSVPSSDELDVAVLWDYSFSVAVEGGTAFEVTYNEERTSAYTLVLEDADGIAQIRVTASSGTPPLVLLPDTTLVAVDGAYRYDTPEGTLLTFAGAASIPIRTVVFERLDVLDVQSVRPAVEGVSFNDLLIPFIENTALIDIGGTPGTIAGHLGSVMQTLLGNSPFASQPAAIECRYGYEIAGVTIEAPVVLVTRQDLAIGFDAPLLEQIASSTHQWLEAVKPPATNARLLFGLTFWSAIPRTTALLLRLANVSLAMGDVIL